MFDRDKLNRIANQLKGIEDEVIALSVSCNEWFTEKSVRRAINSVVNEYLDSEKLMQWWSSYSNLPVQEPSTVMVVTAGNIPLVGFFDLFCSVLVGHQVLLKPSSRDYHLMSYAAKLLNREFGDKIKIVDSIDNRADALLFMGSDAVADELRALWSDKLHLIRSHRISIALISGNESSQQLELLADDVFAYYGLGCRNVTNVFIPKGYDLMKLVGVFNNYQMDSEEYRQIVRRHVARMSVCGEKFVAGDFFVFKEGFSSELPMGELRWIEYDNVNQLRNFIDDNEMHLQCVVSDDVSIDSWRCVPFGRAQQPALKDFPDRVDVIQFLQKIVTFAKQ